MFGTDKDNLLTTGAWMFNKSLSQIAAKIPNEQDIYNSNII